MSCHSPNLAVKLPDRSKLKFLNRSNWDYFSAQRYFGKDNVFWIPCGKCSGCMLQKRKEYAVRCALEAKYHDQNCFITLTYDDEHLSSLNKKDVQDFLKKLWNKRKIMRYFACGELGSKGRPHYHLICFGYKPDDLKYFEKSKSDKSIFMSKEVDSFWKKGIATVQEFSPACAGYVAGYVGKGKNQGFLMMSKRPGLGFRYFLDHKDEIFKCDQIVEDLGTWKQILPPRYCDILFDRFGLDLMEHKEARMKACSDSLIEKMHVHHLKTQDDAVKFDKLKNDNKLNKLRRNL